MRKKVCFSPTVAMLAGLLAAFTATGWSQTLDLTVSDYTTLDEAQVGGTVNGTPMEDAYIGIYSFTVSDVVGIAGLPNGSTIQSICLGPLGDLDLGTYGYTMESFDAAQPGLNPSSWANPVTAPLAGIQNANYLWSEFNSTANTPVLAASLALAMYDALYNSTGYGQTPMTGSGFAPNFAFAGEGTAYTNDITALASYTGNPLAVGYVFVPNDPNAGGPSGQSFIVLDTVVSTVPETSTIVAASLLLLPLGACAWRGLRKQRVG
jgi:hypothetical protein